MSPDPFGLDGALFTPVSPKLSAVRRITLSLTMGIVVVGLVLGAALGDTWPLYLGAGAAVALWVWGWWIIGRQVRALGYCEREDDLLIRSGVMFRRLVVVPYGRMQYVDVAAGPLDRKYGLAAVKLHTASAATDASIPGLSHDAAAELRDSLAARGEARLAGL